MFIFGFDDKLSQQLTIERGCTELLGYSRTHEKFLVVTSIQFTHSHCHCLQFSFYLKSWYWKKNSIRFCVNSFGIKSPLKVKFYFQHSSFVLHVMFTIEIWYSRNKTLSLHSKSYPVVINPSSKLPQKIHDWSIVVNNQVSASTLKPSFQHSSLFRKSSLPLNTKFFTSTFSLCSQPSRGMRPNKLQLLHSIVLVWTSRLTRSSMRVGSSTQQALFS